MSRKTLYILLGVILLAAIGAGAWYFTTGSDSDTTATASGPGFDILPTDKTLGNKNAKVTLIEYAAPSCPVCARFNELTFPQMKAKYIDSGKVFYAFRVFPLRSDDGAAEKIARCLPEDKYFAFVDLLFRKQAQWDVEYGVTDVHGGLVLLGRIFGMSADQVDKCISNTSEDARINKVASDGEARYNITGTPTFILDGVSQGAGFFPIDAMSKMLDTELAKKQ